MREHEIDDRGLNPEDPAAGPGGAPEGACPECGGTGVEADGEPCPMCEGTGKAESYRVGGG